MLCVSRGADNFLVWSVLLVIMIVCFEAIFVLVGGERTVERLGQGREGL